MSANKRGTPTTEMLVLSFETTESCNEWRRKFDLACSEETSIPNMHDRYSAITHYKKMYNEVMVSMDVMAKFWGANLEQKLRWNLFSKYGSYCKVVNPP